MGKISWDFFKCYNQNYTADFERLTRIIFKRYVLKDKNAILTKVSNHPGVENDPYEVNGKKYAFQSKFFESLNSSSYSQLAESLEKIKDTEIDVIYLFSNKDINLDVKGPTRFSNIVKFFNDKKTTIKKICNEEILDLISFNPDYNDLKSIYFNECSINFIEINDNLTRQLNALSPRYVSGFNIDVEIQKYFDVLANQSTIKAEINDYLNELQELIQRDKFDNENIKSSVYEKIDILKNKKDYDLITVFDWINLFSEDIRAVEEYKKEINPDDENSSERIFYCDRFCNTINLFDFRAKPHLQMIKHNVLIIEGEAGTGKSHLLGYEADNLSRNGEIVYLALGHKMIYNQYPDEQFRKELGIRQSSIKEWILQLEYYCKYNSKNAYIMFDAINECKNNEAWIDFINELITLISTTKNVFFIFTIRTTYSAQVLNDSIRGKISNGEIVHTFHNGFKDVIDVAVPAFFTKYNIPLDSPELFEIEFENPLLLKTYCEGYSSAYKENPGNIFSLYENYLKKEENKFDSKHIDSTQHKSQKILSVIAKIMYNNGFLHASHNEICERLPKGTNMIEYFDYLCNEKIFITYYNEDTCDEEVFLNYEKFGEFIIAKEAIKTTKSFYDLVKWCRDSLFKMDKYGRIKYNSIGIFAALSVLARERYEREIICSISKLEEAYINNKHMLFNLERIYDEYLSLYKNTSDIHIHKNEFEHLIEELKLKDNFHLKSVLRLLIDLSGRNNELNIDYLHLKLISKNQIELDSLWTIAINDLGFFPKIDYIIKYINKDNFMGINNKIKYANLLVWLFCSTNRMLRDTASKALVRLLKNDFKLMFDLLVKFDKCCDLYVIERLLCCIYGAAMLSDDYSDSHDVAIYLYNKVFNREYVIPDILIRDHSNCIISCIAKKEQLGLDLSIIRPPYKSNCSIHDYDIEDLIQFYKNNDNKPSGISKLLFSISPDLHDDKNLFPIYGDFGRYTFQARMCDFKIEGPTPYYYALHYVKNILKYDNNKFGIYDINCDNYDRHSHKVERIGKKYEWLTMYHVLAVVSDNYGFEDYNSKEYHGTWDNYCREFDPSILVTSTSKRQFVIDNLPNNKNIEWSDDKEHGLECVDDDVNNLQEYLFGEWITLFDSTLLYSTSNSKAPRQTYSDVVYSYFVPLEHLDKLIPLAKSNKIFPNNEPMIYELYLGEYYDSYGYLNLIEDDSISVEVKVGEEVKKNIVPDFDEKNMSIKYVEKEITYPINKEICRIVPTYFQYRWESEYDYSKEDVFIIEMPSKRIVDFFKLKQKEPGMWYDNDILVCADFSMIKNTLSTGVKIRKKYLDKFLQDNKMSFVVDTYLERRFSEDGWYSRQKVKSRRTLFYLKNDKILKCIYEKDEYSSY